MATTTPKGIPFPVITDEDKPRIDIEELALYVDEIPGIRTVTTAQRNALVVLWPGMLIFNSTTARLEVNRTGTAGDWAALHTNAAALPIDAGGTGLQVAPSLLVNLGSTSAASPLQASPRPGVTGKLPVGHGGTGLDVAPALLVNLGSTSAASPLQASPRPGVTGVLPLGNGGSGHNGLVAPSGSLFTPQPGTTLNSQSARRWGPLVFFQANIDINVELFKGISYSPLKTNVLPLPAIAGTVTARGAAGSLNAGNIDTSGNVWFTPSSAATTGSNPTIWGVYLTAAA